jgi:hypothetical protein
MIRFNACSPAKDDTDVSMGWTVLAVALPAAWALVVDARCLFVVLLAAVCANCANVTLSESTTSVDFASTPAALLLPSGSPSKIGGGS